MYDVFGRRVAKTTYPNYIAKTTYYAYDGDKVIEELDGDGNVEASYVYGTYLDEVLEMWRDEDGDFEIDEADEVYYYLHDDLYNVLALTDANGDIVEFYAYGDYGKPTVYDANYVETGNESAYGNPYLFNGRRWDADTGLYWYRTRYMDPELGRFISRDSIGLWGDEDNLGNPYTYLNNNPWSGLDPYGEGKGDDLLEALMKLSRKAMSGSKIAMRIAGESVEGRLSSDGRYFIVGEPDVSNVVQVGTGNKVPSNSKFAGTRLYFPEGAPGAEKYNQLGGVRVGSSGFMDFSNYIRRDKAGSEFRVAFEKFDDDPNKDFRAAWAAMKARIPGLDVDGLMADWTWHHEKNDLVLIPTEVNRYFSHTGGYSTRYMTGVALGVSEFAWDVFLPHTKAGILGEEDYLHPRGAMDGLMYDLSPHVQMIEGYKFVAETGLAATEAAGDAAMSIEDSNGVSMWRWFNWANMNPNAALSRMFGVGGY